ncbi:MAG: hypothetical protein V1874_07750 [Spirochaetota bacterium]
MPIYKYKSFEDARRALWTYNPDAVYFKRIARLFEIGFRLSPPVCKRGVFPFHSIEEANSSLNRS